jgi:predicted MFS family arabinose efflux permease
MWLIASIFYAYQYVLRVMPSVMLEDITRQFGMSASMLGQFSGVYYVGYSLAHIPLGIALDKYGPRKVVSICAALSAIGALPIVFAEHCAYPIIGRAITGIGSSAAILGAFKATRMAFDERHFTKMLGFSVAIGILGAIYGGSPVGRMCKILSYKSVVGIIAAAGIVLALVAYAVMPNVENRTDNTNDSAISNLREVIFNPKLIALCVSAGLMVGPLEGFADIWGPRFLTRVYKLETSSASYCSSLIFIGMALGAPILTFIAEKIRDYIKTIAFSGATMFAIFALLVGDRLNYAGMIAGFFAAGICSGYQTLAIYKASTYVGENSVTLATAVTNMIIMTFGYFLHSSIGMIVDATAPLGEALALRCGVATIPAALLMGAIGFAIVGRMERRGRG